MNINATLFGQIALVWMIIATVIVGYLAWKKTDTPVIVTLVGALLNLIPVLGLIFMGYLALKQPPKTN